MLLLLLIAAQGNFGDLKVNYCKIILNIRHGAIVDKLVLLSPISVCEV